MYGMVKILAGLNKNQLEQYRREGFIGPFTAVDPEEMSKIRDHIYKNVLSHAPDNLPSKNIAGI